MLKSGDYIGRKVVFFLLKGTENEPYFERLPDLHSCLYRLKPQILSKNHSKGWI